MSDTIIIALISTGGSVLIGITALILNYRMFNSLEKRIERIEQDIKEWYKLFGRLEMDIARLKDHTGLK